MTNPFSKNNNKKSFTPSELIANRESLIADIKDLWSKLYSNNVFPDGIKPLFDLPAIYKILSEKELDLVKTKLAIQAINIGFKSIKSLPKDCVYAQIFLLQQLKERKVKLEKLPTRKNEGESIALTKAFVDKEISSVSLHISRVQKEIDAFNLSVNFELES